MVNILRLCMQIYTVFANSSRIVQMAQIQFAFRPQLLGQSSSTVKVAVQMKCRYSCKRDMSDKWGMEFQTLYLWQSPMLIRNPHWPFWHPPTYLSDSAKMCPAQEPFFCSLIQCTANLHFSLPSDRHDTLVETNAKSYVSLFPKVYLMTLIMSYLKFINVIF